ncbi:MAG TPA: recombinase RecA [bacterium]|jgi:recombination protein RecA
MSKEQSETRQKSLEMAMSQIERQFGKGSVMRLGDESSRIRPDVISTGILSLDIALGVGGIPKGRITEIYGSEGSGKTTLALHIIAESQKMGGTCAFIDAEHALDPSYASKIGVKTDELLISQPDTGEQALEICEMLVKSGAVDVVVIDSVAALVPKAEIEGDMGDVHVGLQARLMSQAMRKLTATVHKTHALIVFINQMRDKIGVMFGSPTTTTGGRALKFYSSIRIEVIRIGSIKQGTDVLGSRTIVKIVKNKVAPPFRQVECDLIYGKGLSRIGDLLDIAVEHDIVKKSGSWFSYGDEKLGQGRENVRDFLAENPDLIKEIETAVKEELGFMEYSESDLETPPVEDFPDINEE